MEGTERDEECLGVEATSTAEPEHDFQEWWSKRRTKIKGVKAVKPLEKERTYKLMEPQKKKPKVVVEDVNNTDMEMDIKSSDLDETENIATEDPLKPTESKYAISRRKRETRWSELRPLIANALVEEKVPKKSECIACFEVLATIIRCTDCGPNAYYCGECCKLRHQYLALHVPQEWSDGRFVPFELEPVRWELAGHDDSDECHSKYDKVLTLLDHRGYPHKQILQFCTCEDEVVTLVRYNFWPSTPTQVDTGISMELMSLLRSQVYTGQVSLTAFTSSLKERFEIQYSMVPEVLRVFTWDMVLSYAVVYHQVTHLENVCPDLSPPECCPACPKDRKVIAMDGNFSLVRRKRKSTTLLPPRHNDRFFLNQEDVDQFVADYNDKTSGPKNCSNFQAGEILRSKNKNDKLDVKGVFGSVCRHDYPYKFLDMKHGERLGYPVYLYNQLKDKTRLLFYDIACKMLGHLKKHVQIPPSIRFAIPIFHVYGHLMSCQVAYSPRRIEGAGLNDGEGTERLWSFLGNFSNISKEMTYENRLDLITELLLHYSTKLTNKMVWSLSEKMRKACLLIETTENELQNLIVTLPTFPSRQTIAGWSESEKARVEKTTHAVPADNAWRGQYAILLHKFYTKSAEMNEMDNEQDESETLSEEIAKLDVQLKSIERRRKVHRRWQITDDVYKCELTEICAEQQRSLLLAVREEVVQYIFLAETRKRYTDGQAIAKRLNKQIHTSSGKINTAIQRFNELPRLDTNIGELIREEAVKLDSAIYTNILDPLEYDPNDQVPPSIKRKLIDINNLNSRAREEVILVTEDILQFQASLSDRKAVLISKLEALKQVELLDRFEAGELATVKDALEDVVKLQSLLENVCGPILDGTSLNIRSYLHHMDLIDEVTPQVEVSIAECDMDDNEE